MKRMIVADLANGTVCRRYGIWGVISVNNNPSQKGRRFDRWNAPPLLLELSDEVEVPTPRTTSASRRAQ